MWMLGVTDVYDILIATTVGILMRVRWIGRVT